MIWRQWYQKPFIRWVKELFGFKQKVTFDEFLQEMEKLFEYLDSVNARTTYQIPAGRGMWQYPDKPVVRTTVKGVLDSGGCCCFCGWIAVSQWWRKNKGYIGDHGEPVFVVSLCAHDAESKGSVAIAQVVKMSLEERSWFNRVAWPINSKHNPYGKYLHKIRVSDMLRVVREKIAERSE